MHKADLIEFHPRHVEEMDLQNKCTAFLKFVDIGDLFKKTAIGDTFIYEGKPICSYGAVPLWEGLAQFWMFVSNDMKNHAMTACKVGKERLEHIIEDLKLHRIEAFVETGNETDQRFAEWFGFEKEALLEQYTPDKQDLFLYRRLR